MFDTKTNLFVTRVLNPTDKPYCHRGLPRYPVIPPGGFVDVPGVYMYLKNDPAYQSALDAGMVYELYTTMKCFQVGDLSKMPAPLAGNPVIPVAAVPEVDNTPVMTEVQNEDGNESRFAAEERAEKGVKWNPLASDTAGQPDENNTMLPPGVVPISDIQKNLKANMIYDSPAAKKSAEALGKLQAERISMHGDPLHDTDAAAAKTAATAEALQNAPPPVAGAKQPLPPLSSLGQQNDGAKQGKGKGKGFFNWR